MSSHRLDLDVQTTYLHLTDALDIDSVSVQVNFLAQFGRTIDR